MTEITEAMHDYDRAVYDGLQAEPPTEPRFFTPVSIPVIPPVTKEGYSAFDSMSDEEVEQFKIREK